MSGWCYLHRSSGTVLDRTYVEEWLGPFRSRGAAEAMRDDSLAGGWERVLIGAAGDVGPTVRRWRREQRRRGL